MAVQTHAFSLRTPRAYLSANLRTIANFYGTTVASVHAAPGTFVTPAQEAEALAANSATTIRNFAAISENQRRLRKGYGAVAAPP
jgi:hypothetical protein